MSLYGVMRTSTSGMAAQANRLSTVADNIANSNTTGYKKASTEFSSLILDFAPGSYTPGSVKTSMRYGISQQGSLLTTNSVTDLAIRGNGFFVVSDADGTSYLSRAGAFVPDSEGNLQNAAGFYLMGYPIENGNIDTLANGTSGLEMINLDGLAMKANATTEGIFRTNLPAGAAIVPAVDVPSANPPTGATYTAKSSLLAYDNLGNQVTLDVYMSKTLDAPPTWEVAVFDRAQQAPGGGFPYASGPLATQTLTFDPANGELTGPISSIDIPVPNGQTMTLDLGGTSQLGADYTVIDAVLNGNEPANVEKVSIANDGTVYATYENGNQVAAFKIPIATLTSPDNLTQLTGNVFAASPDSGAVQVGFAGTGGLGLVMSSSLEQSTVDMATELTTMIDAQRGYNANSKVFQTGAELIDVLINLKR